MFERGVGSALRHRRDTVLCAQVDTRVIQAMKARDKDLTSTLRLIKTALTNAAKESGVEAVSDEEAVKVLRKMRGRRVLFDTPSPPHGPPAGARCARSR